MIKYFELSFVESEVKILLDSLISKEAMLQNICDNTDDEDLAADAGNDLIELRLLLNPIKEKAIQSFGPNILNFSSDQL